MTMNIRLLLSAALLGVFLYAMPARAQCLSGPQAVESARIWAEWAVYNGVNGLNWTRQTCTLCTQTCGTWTIDEYGRVGSNPYYWRIVVPKGCSNNNQRVRGEVWFKPNGTWLLYSPFHCECGVCAWGP